MPCGACGKSSSADARPCPRCRDVSYCNKECQKADWQKHKKTCAVHNQKSSDVTVCLGTPREEAYGIELSREARKGIATLVAYVNSGRKECLSESSEDEGRIARAIRVELQATFQTAIERLEMPSFRGRFFPYLVRSKLPREAIVSGLHGGMRVKCDAPVADIKIELTKKGYEFEEIQKFGDILESVKARPLRGALGFVLLEGADPSKPEESLVPVMSAECSSNKCHHVQKPGIMNELYESVVGHDIVLDEGITKPFVESMLISFGIACDKIAHDKMKNKSEEPTPEEKLQDVKDAEFEMVHQILAVNVKLRERVGFAMEKGERGMLVIRCGQEIIEAEWKHLSKEFRSELIWERDIGPNYQLLGILNVYDPEKMFVFKKQHENATGNEDVSQVIPHPFMSKAMADKFVADLKENKVECVEKMKKEGLL